jgi:hypothetical protein
MQELLASVNADLADLASLGTELGPSRGCARDAQSVDFRADLESSGAFAADRSGGGEAASELGSRDW